MDDAVPGSGASITVAALHLAAEPGAPMQSVTELSIGWAGIAGDRYEGSTHRHVSVETLDELALSAARLRLGDGDGDRDADGGVETIVPGSTRRNVTLSAGRLVTVPGTVLVIGDVELEVVRRAAPCRVLEESVGAGARAAFRGLGGVICRVRRPGTIACGAPASGAGLRPAER